MRAALGACCAVCGWSIGSGGYIPMWMWGLVALPMLGIAMEWFVAGRRWVPGALLVTLAWLGNFYTAAMATVAAGLLLVVRLLLADLAWRARIFAAVRAGTATLCGIAVTAVLLYPTLLSSKASQPTRLDDFVPATTESFLASALPASYMPGEAPRLFVATIALVLALAFCLNRRIAPGPAPRGRSWWSRPRCRSSGRPPSSPGTVSPAQRQLLPRDLRLLRLRGDHRLDERREPAADLDARGRPRRSSCC
ncbi:YfhO family protein [Yinghuangia aomiensis]